MAARIPTRVPPESPRRRADTLTTQLPPPQIVIRVVPLIGRVIILQSIKKSWWLQAIALCNETEMGCVNLPQGDSSTLATLSWLLSQPAYVCLIW